MKTYSVVLVLLGAASCAAPESGGEKADAAIAQGDAFFALNDFEKAIECYSLAIGENPRFVKSFLKRGLAYDAQSSLSTGEAKIARLNSAVADYKAATMLKPGDPEAFHRLGLAYIQLGQGQNAREAFATAAAMGHFESKRALRVYFGD